MSTGINDNLSPWPAVYRIQRAEDVFKLNSVSGTSIILDLSVHAPIPNSRGNRVSGGVKYTGVEKVCDFRLKSPFISETVLDRPMVTMEL